jgi:streptogramin lyase
VNRTYAVLAVALLSATPAAARGHPGVGIVMDSRGNVYYTDLANVWRVGTDGRRTIAVPNVHTHELYLSPGDTLYGEHLWYEGEASNRWGHYVWRRLPSGRIETVIPAREGFISGYSFTRDAGQDMYWIERQPTTVIHRRSSNGHVTRIRANENLRSSGWTLVAPDGVIYVVDAGDLKRIDLRGKVTTLARGLITRSLSQFHVSDQHAVMGLWLDRASNVYAAIYSGRVIKKISPNGRVTVVARSSIPWSPTGGLVAPNGDLWVLEYALRPARVRRIPAAVRLDAERVR